MDVAPFLDEKILRIGMMMMDELILHRDEVIVSMTKSIVFDDSQMITINGHPTAHISDDEIICLRNRRND